MFLTWKCGGGVKNSDKEYDFIPVHLNNNIKVTLNLVGTSIRSVLVFFVNVIT